MGALLSLVSERVACERLTSLLASRRVGENRGDAASGLA